MIRNQNRRLGATGCGDYPAASSFAAEPFRPLTADENARYLAAAAIYNACKQTEAGAPQGQCPPGSSFQGGMDQFGNWQGQCVSTFTGQPTTGLINQRSGAPATVTGPPASSGPTAINARIAVLPEYPAINYAQPGAAAPQPTSGAHFGTDTVPIVGHTPFASVQLPQPVQTFLDDVPSWGKWAAAGVIAALFLFGGKSR